MGHFFLSAKAAYSLAPTKIENAVSGFFTQPFLSTAIVKTFGYQSSRRQSRRPSHRMPHGAQCPYRVGISWSILPLKRRSPFTTITTLFCSHETKKPQQQLYFYYSPEELGGISRGPLFDDSLIFIYRMCLCRCLRGYITWTPKTTGMAPVPNSTSSCVEFWKSRFSQFIADLQLIL